MSPLFDVVRGALVFTSALSLLVLFNHWLGLGLSNFFQYLRDCYAYVAYPMIDLVRPLLQFLSELLGVALPVWWRDLVTLVTTLSVSLYSTQDSEVSEDGRRRSASWEAGVRITVEFSVVFSLLFALNWALRLLAMHAL